MKKLSLIVLLMFLTLMVTAQKYYTYQVSYGKWDESKKNYVYAPSIKKEMEFNLNGNVIDIADRVHCTYTIPNSYIITNNEKSEINKWNGVWDGLDQQNKKCKIVCRINNELNEVRYSILYDDVVFQYFIKIN